MRSEANDVRTVDTCDRLLRFDFQMRRLRYHLQCLQQDLRLMDGGWRIHYALDWCELNRYAFGFQDFVGRPDATGPSSKVKKAYVEKVSAARFLLAGIHRNARCVLLPPYVSEMIATLEYTRSRTLREEVQLEKLRWLLERDGGLIAALREIAQRRLAEPERPIPRSLLTAIYRRLGSEFRDVLLLRLAVADNGVRALRGLLQGEKRRLYFLDEVDDEAAAICRGLTDGRSVLSSKWFAAFQGMRTRWVCNFHDAWALEVISVLNQVRRDDKKLFAIVSDAPTMTHALNWDLLDWFEAGHVVRPRGVAPAIEPGDGAEEFRLLRTPRTFLLLLLYSRESEPAPLRIERTLNDVRSYFTLAAGIVRHIKEQCVHSYDRQYGRLAREEKTACNSCPYGGREGDLGGLLKKYEKLRVEYEGVQLLLRRDAYLSDFGTSEKARLDELYGVDLVDTLLEFADAERLSAHLRARREKLDKALLGLEGDVTNVTILEAPGERMSAIGYNIERFLKIVGRLGFQDPTIRSAVNQVEVAVQMGEGNGERVRGRLLELFQLSKTPNGKDGERVVLQAALAYVCGEREFCRDLCDSALRAAAGNEFALRYLGTLARCAVGMKTRDPDQVLSALADAAMLTQTHEEDARSWHLLGLLRFRVWMKKIDVEIAEDDVFGPLERAKSLATNRELESTAVNNELYALCRIGWTKPEWRPRVESALACLQGEMGQGEEWASFRDTEGCALMWLCRFESELSKKEAFRATAIQSFNRALHLARTRGAGADVITEFESHLREAMAPGRGETE